MKHRGLCALLACALLLAPLTAARGEIAAYTLMEKLTRQVDIGSGLRVSFTLDAGQTAPWFADAATWPLQRAALRLLSGTATYQNRDGIQETSITLSAGDQVLTNANVVKDGGLLAANTALWGGQWLGMQLGDATLYDALANARGQWPQMLGVLRAVLSGDEDWNARGETALSPYVLKLSQWLQGYGRTSIARDDQNRTITVRTYAIPAGDVVPQLKLLLTDLYNDPTALALLSERLSAPQIAAYLQPGMRDALFHALDAQPLTGTATLVTAKTLTGLSSWDSLSLPMPGGNALGLEHVDLRVDADGGFALEARFETRLENGVTGAQLYLDAQPLADAQAGALSYTGQMIYEPEMIVSDSWVVGSGSGQALYSAPVVALRASLDVTNTDKPGATEGVITARLLVRPIADHPTAGELLELPAHTLTLTAKLTSSATRSAPTYIDASLSYEELDTGAALTLSASARTASPWRSAVINSASLVRLDNMTPTQLTTYLDAIRNVVSQNLARLIAQ